MEESRQYKFTKEVARELLPQAIKRSFYVHVDELSIDNSAARHHTDKTIGDVLDIGLDDEKMTHFHFIERKQEYVGKRPYFDVGLSTLNPGDTDYFLWIEVSIEEGEQLVREFDVTQVSGPMVLRTKAKQ